MTYGSRRQTAIVLLLLDSLRGERSVPLTIESGAACFKHSCGALAETRCTSCQVLACLTGVLRNVQQDTPLLLITHKASISHSRVSPIAFTAVGYALQGHMDGQSSLLFLFPVRFTAMFPLPRTSLAYGGWSAVFAK